MDLNREELEFLNSVLSQINPRGLEANVMRVELWARVQAELESLQEEDEDPDNE